LARSDEKTNASSLPCSTPPLPIAASRAATASSLTSRPISPASPKSSIAVSIVMLATLSSPSAFITPSAEASSVPPTQNPSVFTRAAPVISRATSMACITPSSR
jgi:hypothetical protein